MPATTIEAVMQMRRGLENDLDISQLRIGEWALSTDRKWVRICYAEGKVIKIASQEAMDETLAEIQEIEDAILVMKNAAAASATSASGSATAADGSAEDAEAWAVGKRGGVNVPSTDPAYNNNSKYWAEHTSSSLAGLSDTDISNPSNNDVLKYNGTSGKWENGAGGGSGSGGHTIEDASGTALTQRDTLQFKGTLKVSDDSTNEKTVISDEAEEVEWSVWDAMTEAERNAYSAGKKLDIINAPWASGNINTEVFTKLWENPEPTSAFAAQTITLASDDYDFLFIDYSIAVTTVADSHLSQIIPKNNTGVLDLAYSDGTGVLNSYRQLSITNSTSIWFDDCYWVNSSAMSTDNNRIMPIAIYGFKKNIKFDLTALVANVSTDASKCMLSDGVTSVENALASKSQIKFKVVTGTTDATANLVLSDLNRLNSYVLSASGTLEGTGTDLTYLIGGIPMVTAGGNWFVHVSDYAGTERANANISLKVAYIEL